MTTDARLALALQRRAGNRAVARLIAPQRMLARYESAEHVAIGDRYLRELSSFVTTAEGQEWVRRYGLDTSGLAGDELLTGGTIRAGGRNLTAGDVIALGGDFYASPEALARADPREIDDLRDAMDKERRRELHGSELNAKYQEITLRYRPRSESYLELAKKNAPHFTPGNRREWRRLHEVALEIARRPITSDDRINERNRNEALLTDAFACHFLTDAFAAGHLFDKTTLEAAIRRHLQNNPARPANPELSAYYGLVSSQGATDLLVLKNIHDRLNAEGFEVTNAKGMRWRTYGDDRLARSADTQRIAALAVFMSRRQLSQARAGGDPRPEDVLALLPDDASVARATELAISYIPAAVADIGGLMYRQRGIASTELGKVAGSIVESNLAVIAAPGRERQILEAQETARRTGLPTPAPQFQVLSW
jgi:hypothetical protein